MRVTGRRPRGGPRYLDAAALRAERATAGMEQEDLGIAAGIDPRWARSTIAHYEAGDYGCSIRRVHRLARALGCEPRALLLPGVLAGADRRTVVKLAASFGCPPASLPDVLGQGKAEAA